MKTTPLILMPFPDATPDDAWTRHAAASEQVQVAFTEGPAATLAAALTQSPEDEHHEGRAPSWKHLDGTWHITDHEGKIVERGTLTAGKHDLTGAGIVRVTWTVVDDEGKTSKTSAVVLSKADRCPA